MFAWWFICKVTQWSHNPISVELLHARFIGFLFILNASKRHRRFSGLTFSFTMCKIWKGNHVRIIIKKINACHYHWTATVSFKWITIIVTKKNLFTHSPQKIIVTIKRSILYDAWDISITCHLILASWHSHWKSIQPVLAIMLESWREHRPLLWPYPSCLSQLSFPVSSKG